MSAGLATIPFIFPETVVLVKEVPAEVCNSCREPYVAGNVTDRLTHVLDQLRSIGAEVSIIAYPELQTVSPTTHG